MKTSMQALGEFNLTRCGFNPLEEFLPKVMEEMIEMVDQGSLNGLPITFYEDLYRLCWDVSGIDMSQTSEFIKDCMKCKTVQTKYFQKMFVEQAINNGFGKLTAIRLSYLLEDLAKQSHNRLYCEVLTRKVR